MTVRLLSKIICFPDCTVPLNLERTSVGLFEMAICLNIKTAPVRINIVQMERGKINFILIIFSVRVYAMEDTMVYDGMIFKANHNLFEVKYKTFYYT